MRTYRLLTVLSICAGLVAGSMSLTSALAQDAQRNAPAQQETRNALSVGQVHDKLTAAGYTGIDKVERERNAYEVKATDKNGARVKLYVDAQTGDIIDSRQRDKDSERARRAAAEPQPR